MNGRKAGVRFWAAVLLAAGSAASAHALPALHRMFDGKRLAEINQQIAGRLLDFTSNHAGDRRLWSQALGEKRDVYVYLPPGYDGTTPYPAMIWLHGFGQDEMSFLDVVGYFDHAIRCGRMPPMVVAAPDGSTRGRPSFTNAGSFYLNSDAGRFEDFVVCDVWGFLLRNWAVRPEREAHVLAGGSMGGCAAYHIGFHYRHTFGVLAGVMPPLDLRYADCRGRYFTDYDPACNAYNERMRPQRVIGRFGLIRVRERRMTEPLVGRRSEDGIRRISDVNPVEMLDRNDIRPGEFPMFVSYTRGDEFNIDAQCEHFLDVARRRGIYPTVEYLPDGKHNLETAARMFPAFARFINEHVGPYAPPVPPLPGGGCTDLLCGAPRAGLFRREPAPAGGPAGWPVASPFCNPKTRLP